MFGIQIPTDLMNNCYFGLQLAEKKTAMERAQRRGAITPFPGQTGFGSSAVLKGSTADGAGYGAGSNGGKPLSITELDAGENERQGRRVDRADSYVFAGESDPDRMSPDSPGKRPESHYFSFKPPTSVTHQATNTVDYMTSVGVQAKFRPTVNRNIP